MTLCKKLIVFSDIFSFLKGNNKEKVTACERDFSVRTNVCLMWCLGAVCEWAYIQLYETSWETLLYSEAIASTCNLRTWRAMMKDPFCVNCNEVTKNRYYNFILFRNVVSTVNLACPLDLMKINFRTRNSEYNPSKFSGIVMRIREPHTTALLFRSGKVVITGARNEADSRLAARKYARIIQKLGFPVSHLHMSWKFCCIHY